MADLPRLAQLDRADLAGMFAEQIQRHSGAGALATVLGGTAPVDWSAVGQLDRAGPVGLTPAEIATARAGGHLADLLGDPAEIDRERRERWRTAAGSSPIGAGLPRPER